MKVEDAEGTFDELVAGSEGDQIAQGASTASVGSYDEAQKDKKKLIERIDNSFKQFQCLPIDPLFHYFAEN